MLFALGLTALCGLAAMSIDLGRFLWARTQMQSAVDAAAHAGAQSMPFGKPQAQTYALQYFGDNTGSLQNNADNIAAMASFPTGNKAVEVTGTADVPMTFARVLGLKSMHVTATATAASQVLDIAVVLDISGSMCFTSFPPVEGSSSGLVMSPGRLTPAGASFPKLVNTVPAGGPSATVIQLNDVGIFASTNAGNNNTNFGSKFNSATPYWNFTPSGGRRGIIRIGSELFQISAVNTATNELNVTRGVVNKMTGLGTPMQAHPAGAEVWANRSGQNGDYCEGASYSKPTSAQNGPAEPFDTAIADAKYFVDLFDGSYDRIGVVAYSNKASTQINLTGNFGSVHAAMDGILFPTGSTNIAHGLSEGRRVVNGPNSRPNGVKIVVLLTDGVPNTYCSNGYASGSCSTASAGTPTSCPASSQAIADAVAQASAAAAEGAIVYTIGLGNDVLDCVLQQIADAGNGSYYKAPSAANLAGVFKKIADETHIAITQ